jgi:inorganic pyrophosphatase
MPITTPFYRWRPHPWHGLDPGPDAPKIVQAYIEITPFDLVKYEVDKTTGYVRVDRPQTGSSLPPTLYGFIPKTYCAGRVCALSPTSKKGDGDPLDICVISERPISRAEIILSARVVGGLQVVDKEDADDKIIAVLANDNIWANAKDVSDVPEAYVQRLQHYFSTYKLVPDSEPVISIQSVYGRDHALKVISASLEDYDEAFGRDTGQ